MKYYLEMLDKVCKENTKYSFQTFVKYVRRSKSVTVSEKVMYRKPCGNSEATIN